MRSAEEIRKKGSRGISPLVAGSNPALGTFPICFFCYNEEESVRKMSEKFSYLLCFTRLFKKQVMVDYLSNTSLSASIRVETPTLLLCLPNCFANIFLVTNFNALPLFRCNITFCSSIE